MAGPWRVRFVRKDDPVWDALVRAGLLPDGHYADRLFRAAKRDPAAVMRAAGGFMPWPMFRHGRDGPDAAPLGAFVLCPQCGDLGSIYLRHDPRVSGPVWDWDGSTDAPTLSPSIHLLPPRGCGGHYFLRAGVLTDCGGHRGRTQV